MDSLDRRRTRPAQTNAEAPLRETASQTAGPYVHIGCLPNAADVRGIYPNDLTVNRNLPNAPITISGKVFEGDNVICKDVMLEFWHADESGCYDNGIWHRSATNSTSGLFSICTQMPGKTKTEDGKWLAPFVSVWITARGINLGLLTRVYFPDHESALHEDPHMKLVPESRRRTLMAEKVNGGYCFNIYLQGSRETVFFDV